MTDHLSPLLRPDSDIAKSYVSASTKTTCLMNGSLAPFFKSELVTSMKHQSFGIAVDGSNYTGLEKMHPMTVRIFMWLLGVVVRRYIDFLILLIPTPLVSVLFAAASLLFFHFVISFIIGLYEAIIVLMGQRT